MESLTYPSFLASEFPQVEPSHALFVILPVPCEKSVSYGHGTLAGPSAILHASQQLEATVDGMRPGDAGIATYAPIDCTNTLESIFASVESSVVSILSQKKIPIILGGEHTVTFPVLRAYAQYGTLPGVVQFDAHADLRNSYEGSLFSHACVMRRAVVDLGCSLLQIGVRDFCEEEEKARKEHCIYSYDANALFDAPMPSPCIPDDFPKDVYISFDVDCFDASLMPATGTPSPGGLFWHQVRHCIEQIACERRIIGFDVVELAPKKDLHSCDFTTAKLTYLLMGHTLQSVRRG